MDLIVKLLDKDRSKRLGSKEDFFEVLQHPVFKNINIDDLENKKIKPSFIPDVLQNLINLNVEESKKAISDTFIPSENRKIVE